MQTYVLEIRHGKIHFHRKWPKVLNGASPLPFAHQEDLQALVLGWPWLPKQESLLLGPEADPIFYVGVSGARCDALGISQSGRLVAVELPLDPFTERKRSMRRLLRGLQRLDTHRRDNPQDPSQARARQFGPYPPVAGKALAALLVGDASTFQTDGKQAKKIAKDFRALCDTPAERWDIDQRGKTEKLDQATPTWLRGLGDVPIQLLVLGLRRFVVDKSHFVVVERQLDQVFQAPR